MWRSPSCSRTPDTSLPDLEEQRHICRPVDEPVGPIEEVATVSKSDDQLSDDPPRNRGRGAPLMYTRTTRRDAVVDLLSAYKWILVIILGGLLITRLLGWWSLPSPSDVPPEVWSLLYYAVVGMIPGAPVAWYLYRRWHTVEGTEVWDHDPISDGHRHLRLGTQLWDDLVVLSPWGESVGRHELRRCTINGRSGVELMDLRVKQDGTPICVAPFVGEATSSQMRTYRSALVYARRIMSKKANQAIMERANREPIAREIAEKVVVWHIEASEETGVPGASEIESVVQDTLNEMDLGDPLSPDDLDVEPDAWTARDNGSAPEGVEQPMANGGGEE